MKKWMSVSIMIFLTLLLLFSCSKKKDADALAFPNTTWGMSVDDVFGVYEITKADTTVYDDMSRSTMFALDGYEAFGEKTSRITFHFGDFWGHRKKELCRVRVSYPEGTDMNRVLKELQGIYGQTVPNVIVYLKLSVFDDKLSENQYTESEHVRIWANHSIDELIPQNEAKNYEQGWEIFQDGLTEENWDEFSQNASMVTVIWSTTENGNTLDFDAYNLLVYKGLSSQLSGQ